MKKWWEVPSALAHYLRQGYVLNIPGGKSKDGGHASFGFQTKVGDSGKIEILVIGYNVHIKTKSNDKEKTRICEKPQKCLKREFEEETGVRLIVFKLLGKRSIGDKINHYQTHTQYVYRVYGSDATKIKRVPPPEGARITEPFWVPLWYLKLNLFKGHQWMLSLLIKELQNEYPDMMLN